MKLQDFLKEVDGTEEDIVSFTICKEADS